MRAGDVDLPNGTRAVGVPEMIADDGELASEGFGRPMRAAVEIAAEAVQRADALGRPLREVLNTERFSTILGEIGFAADGQSDWRAVRPLVFDGETFVPIADK